MTVPTAMAAVIEIKTQSGAVRGMVKEWAAQISPIGRPDAPSRQFMVNPLLHW
jgi:hypothetical protein